MLRRATVEMDANLTQEEFEEWLLDLMKKVALDKNRVKIVKDDVEEWFLDLMKKVALEG
jgi:hypothetical protein